MKSCFLLLTIGILSIAGVRVAAQNPVIGGQFAADPTARVFEGKMYVFPSHDIPAPEGQRQDWFCMEDYHVFSSEDLVNWTDHGVIVAQDKVPWVKPDSYAMWAPDCVYKDGTYYFYFPAAPANAERGFAVGVATAERPEGPYHCEQQPIKGVMGIDPCVLVDDDGRAYIYWSGMGIRGARLKDNMKELADPLTKQTLPQAGSIEIGGQAMEGLPEGFKEGPFAFKRDGHYYLTFPWVRKEGGTETLAYAMSDNPLGPWTFKGLIMEEHENGCWTNHHSIVHYKGQWYLFYHHNDYSPSFDKLRSVCIDRLSFRPDGTIVEVKPTLRGVGVIPATALIQVDRFGEAGNGVTIAYNDTLQPFHGWHAKLPAKDSWLRFADVDFSSLRADAYAVVRVKAKANTEMSLRSGKKLLARIPIKVITERGQFRRDQSNQWLTLTAPLEYLPKGVADIVVRCEDKDVDIDCIQFRNRPDYFTAVPLGRNPLSPDSAGFIRRWSLLEPISYEVRSNIILTDSYLKDMMVRELPKVNSKKGKWHVMDSNTFNVRLFRFAEQTGCEPYNSLFWGETTIVCPQELTNVRLAAGSNGASCWWLNGEAVLTLEGDRRMVEDDGMSQRLTLKKGSNVLRFCLVNGPGLSDLCVRFVNEKGKPVTYYFIP
ncbi:MAG: family 43 glycosylhydrolase [Prevotella sp.]|nr:family 43 glycosylhydrolase [Prevotella sp.]